MDERMYNIIIEDSFYMLSESDYNTFKALLKECKNLDEDYDKFTKALDYVIAHGKFIGKINGSYRY